MRLTRALPLLLLTLLAAACTDRPAQPLGPTADAPAPRARDPRFTSIVDADGNPVPVTVPADPYPQTMGIWLGLDVSDVECFADHNPGVVDQDRDWLDDGCEYQLAHAFRPLMKMSPNDNCPGGEPYWAATYLPARKRVRIAYMPAYYRDCGNEITGHHSGDSEFIVAQLFFDRSTRHWQLERAYLSAHHNEYVVDASGWEEAHNLQYREKVYGYPTVYAAKDKHANYRSESRCEGGMGGMESCNGYTGWFDAGRVWVLPHRNAGSRHVDFFPSCVASEKMAGVFPFGGTECFYTRREFYGWTLRDYALDGGSSAYRDYLMSEAFEVWGLTSSLLPLLGPGPDAPATTTLRALSDGPGIVPGYGTASWTARARGGTAPYTYRWVRRDLDVAGETTVVGTGSSYTGYQNGCTGFMLELTVTDATGAQFTDSRSISDYGHPCTTPYSVSLSGPTTASYGATPTFYAAVSGSSGFRYEWWKRNEFDQVPVKVGTGSSVRIDAGYQAQRMEIQLKVWDAQNRLVTRTTGLRVTSGTTTGGTGGGGTGGPGTMQ